MPKISQLPNKLLAVLADVIPILDVSSTTTKSITITELVAAITSSITPPGMMAATAQSSAPSGWLLCNGQAVSRTTYAALFAAIGTTYGIGDGSTTFTLPDLRGRTIMGVDSGAGRLQDNNALGQAAGNGTNTHQHMTMISFDGGALYVTTSGTTVSGSTPASRIFGSPNHMQPGNTQVAGTVRQDATYDTTIDIRSPYQVCNYMIKT